jgi:hypothetical protein
MSRSAEMVREDIGPLAVTVGLRLEEQYPGEEGAP